MWLHDSHNFSQDDEPKNIFTDCATDHTLLPQMVLMLWIIMQQHFICKHWFSADVSKTCSKYQLIPVILHNIDLLLLCLKSVPNSRWYWQVNSTSSLIWQMGGPILPNLGILDATLCLLWPKMAFKQNTIIFLQW